MKRTSINKKIFELEYQNEQLLDFLRMIAALPSPCIPKPISDAARQLTEKYTKHNK